MLHNVLKDQIKVRSITMAEARLNDQQSLLAFNDLFIGVRGHISARYLIKGKQTKGTPIIQRDHCVYRGGINRLVEQYLQHGEWCLARV